MYLYYVDKQLQWYYAMTELYIIKAAFHMEYNNIFGVIWIKFQQKIMTNTINGHNTFSSNVSIDGYLVYVIFCYWLRIYGILF